MLVGNKSSGEEIRPLVRQQEGFVQQFVPLGVGHVSGTACQVRVVKPFSQCHDLPHGGTVLCRHFPFILCVLVDFGLLKAREFVIQGVGLLAFAVAAELGLVVKPQHDELVGERRLFRRMTHHDGRDPGSGRGFDVVHRPRI